MGPVFLAMLTFRGWTMRGGGGGGKSLNALQFFLNLFLRQ